MVEPPVRRTGQRLGTVVLDELKERLLSGQYPAGSRISIEEVKAEFGVSKQPVMDAMRRLEATGIVQIVPAERLPGRALHRAGDPGLLQPVRPFRGRDRRRGRHAAHRHPARRARRHVAAHRRLEHTNDTTARSRGYRFLNREFHLVIHHMSHCRVMAELSERMWDMSDFFINTIGGAQHLSDALVHRNHDHDVIRSAIRSRNAEVARVAMQSHIVETVALFRDDLEEPA